MAKESGLGMTVTIDDSGGTARDISNDIKSLSFSTPQGLIDVTGVDVSAMERIIGLDDFSLQITVPALNDTANKSFDVLKTRTGSRTVAIAISGNTMTAECYISDVSWARGDDGSLAATATFQLANGTKAAWS